MQGEKKKVSVDEKASEERMRSTYALASGLKLYSYPALLPFLNLSIHVEEFGKLFCGQSEFEHERG